MNKIFNFYFFLIFVTGNCDIFISKDQILFNLLRIQCAFVESVFLFYLAFDQYIYLKTDTKIYISYHYNIIYNIGRAAL